MNRPRFLALPVQDPDGRRIGWGIFLSRADNTPRMAAGFTGPFAGWRARYRVASLNRGAPAPRRSRR